MKSYRILPPIAPFGRCSSWWSSDCKIPLCLVTFYGFVHPVLALPAPIPFRAVPQEAASMNASQTSILGGSRANRKLCPGQTLNDAGQKSAWGKRSAGECRLSREFREIRFWITGLADDPGRGQLLELFDLNLALAQPALAP